MAKILDGKMIRDRIAEKMAEEIEKLKVKPVLAIFQVGNREDSSAYIRQKKLLGEKIGAAVLHKQFPETVKENEILAEIKKANGDKNIHGIILQIPIPASLNKNKLIDATDPAKDVDGLTATNLRLLWENDKTAFVPATSLGILTLLDSYNIEIAGKNVVVVGRSSLVGKPTALALLNRDATVTTAHKETIDLPSITKQADILVVAIGDPKFIDSRYVKNGAVVVDVGINVGRKKLEEETTRSVVGDVDFKSVEPTASALSPVPGGVGPMTVLSLFQNLLEAYKRQML